MSTQIRVYNTSGSLILVTDRWDSLQYTRKVNDIGNHTLRVTTVTPDGEDLSQFFSLDNIVEIYRNVDDGPMYLEYGGFHRTPQHQLTARDWPLFISYGISWLDLVKRRVILYYAKSANTIKSDPGETVIKEFVDENCGPSAVSPTRLASGVMPGFTVEATQGRGDTWAGQRSYHNVLDVIQEIGIETNIDFDVVRTSGANFEFRCYQPYGTDRRNSVVFAPLYGNMINPSYTLSRAEEATRVAVLGSEQASYRRYVIRESTAINDSPWNLIEDTQDSRREDSLTYMNQTGDERLEEVKAQEKFSFDVLQTSSMKYGRDYFLGDIVTARFRDIERTMKITQVDFNVVGGKEQIRIDMEIYNE